MQGQPFTPLDPTQHALVAEAQKFVAQEITPNAAKYDQSGDFPEEIIRKGIQTGLMNLTISDRVGGLGLSLHDACLIIEEIAAGCGGFATSMVANDLALTPVLLAGTAEQQDLFVAPVVEQSKFASFCLTEPGAGSDAAGLSTKYERTNAGFEITGTKQWITNGGYASQYTLFATADRSKGHRGISCFIVPRDTPGIAVGPHEDKLGQRCSNTVQVSFDQVVVPEQNLIGPEGNGFKVAMQTLDFSRPMTAILAVGMARRALELASEYARQRKQFGQPIGDFQGIQWMLADMATRVEAARLLTLRSAKVLDRGDSATLESSMAKRFAADIAMDVTTDAVQIFGGYGYTKDYPVEKLFRDAKLMQIYEGTSQIQRLVIAREMSKRWG